MSPSREGAAQLARALDTDELNTVLGADLFADVPRSSLESVLPRCHVLEVESGRALIERSRKNEHLFMVLRGSLRVHLDDGRMPHQVLLGAGECVGEISVIDGRGATATVVTAAPTRLLRIDRETLWYLIGSTESVARNLLLIFSGRVRRDNDLLLASLGQRRELERMATVDKLTGLHNRRWLDDVFARQMERCTRTGTTVSLLFADVDSFKEFNDRYGHLTGDRALQHVAAVLTCLRPTGLLARATAARNSPSCCRAQRLEQAMLVAERVRSALAGKPFAVATTPAHS
jgi:diguanylate cyclase (GGDEF)-like protein